MGRYLSEEGGFETCVDELADRPRDAAIAAAAACIYADMTF